MNKDTYPWIYALVIVAADYALYELYVSANEDCSKQPFVSSTLCATWGK